MACRADRELLSLVALEVGAGAVVAVICCGGERGLEVQLYTLVRSAVTYFYMKYLQYKSH